ncbi:MAG TPA: sigma 54 modulation/S30EA ribosomal C-terminal domain-containing protein [Thermoleophilaceae bacterium]|nr:sigma 54 modulation/S30EA ribosomal C-terminal domain-containing protein [Thermoleophilaceae bacterium]
MNGFASGEAGVTPIDVTVEGDASPAALDAARQRFASLERFAGKPLAGARLALRRGKPHANKPWTADASVLYGEAGRVLAAHAAGRDPLEATDAVFERLRRQLRRVADAEVAQRNEPRVIRAAVEDLDRGDRPEARLKPPEERDIVHRRTYVSVPVGTLDAVADLLDLDVEFLLVKHVRTNEDVVVYRRDDGRIGLIHPPGSALADENDIVVPEPSRYTEPLTLRNARDEMDVLNHRFLYFVDAADGRGKVLYLRHDGDYGLVEPR